MAKRPHLNPYHKRLAIEALPRWAQDLLLARYIRRIMDNYRCAHPSATGIDLIEAAAALLETGDAKREALKACRAPLERLLERFDVPEIRGPIADAMSACRGYYSVTGMHGPGDAATNRADNKLLDRTEQRDLHILENCVENKQRSQALQLLGTLWPLGEPQWKHAAWPTVEQMRKRLARIWCDDAPPMLRRSASLPISENLPEVLREHFAAHPFDMVYRAQYESSTPKKKPGTRAITTYRPRDHKIRFTTPGEHLFREPCDPETLRQFRVRCGDGPASLKLLLAFYREHDGGLLFKPVKGGEADAHLYWYGLDDQEHAMPLVRYFMEDLDPDGPRLQVFCSNMDCDLDSAFCLAQIDASFFLVPLSGKHAGHVFRFSVRAGRISEFARTVEDALSTFVKKIAALSGQFGPSHAIGDELQGAVSEMRLVSVKLRKG